MRRDEMEQKADRGSVPAQVTLGIAHLYGYQFDDAQVEPDYAKARTFLEAASAQGAPRALSNLGYMHENGLGCSKDLPRAIELYERSVRGGEYFPCLWLARIYAHGKVGDVDPQRAAHWYAKVQSFRGKVDDDEGLAEADAFLGSVGDA